jgi:hypothetical protein
VREIILGAPYELWVFLWGSFSWGLLSLSCMLCCALFFAGCTPVYLLARPFGFLIYNTLLIKKEIMN